MSNVASDRRTYPPQYFSPLFTAEDRHFWFRARGRVIEASVSELVSRLPAGYRVLEVGCGTGSVLRVLAQTCSRGHVIGMDLFIEGLRFARTRTLCPLVQADVHMPPFGAAFNIIGLFDVLEHLPDDLQILRDLNAMLAPGGALLLTVPAYPCLWSYFDEASHHCRRYSPPDIEAKLRDAGFHLDYLTPYMLTLFPLIWVGRRVAQLFGSRSAPTSSRSDELALRELQVTPVINGVLRWTLRWEPWFVRSRKRLPFGTSLLVIARKA